MRWLLDRIDDRRARRLRATLGRRGWLVSWHRVGDGPWLARLSCPSLASTLERTGTSRTKAIGRAARALTLLLTFRDQINRRTVRPGRDEDPPDDPWF